jgi:quercetin dioxygenase-like cupin family protein
MGRLVISKPEDRSVFHAVDRIPEDQKARFTDGELRAAISAYFPKEGGERLQLFELHMEPGDRAESHAHTEDEIIVIIDGEMHMGNRVLPKGSALYIEKDTLYAFGTGPEGCTFLNFRPSELSGYLTKDEFMAQRRERNEAEHTLGEGNP